tara:strand:- start:303 stop:1112 length:810 start_codon:yes stop_codon:yes gene_type:complete
MLSKNIYNFCNNCGKYGHSFHKCNHPITSLGIIVYRYNTNINDFEYLMIRRKDSLGFVDFMRGKYQLSNKNYIKNIIDEMTSFEKYKILNYDFDKLWNDLWGNNIGNQYRNEEKNSREKFYLLKNGILYNGLFYNLFNIVEESFTNWEETEWGFPKGRRNFQEKDLTCALREFEEETGYSKNDLNIIYNLIPFEEIFTGSNLKSYKHKYFIANIDFNTQPNSPFQASEVSKINWLSYPEVIKKIRPYNLEKLDIIKRVNELLNKYTLYS